MYRKTEIYSRISNYRINTDAKYDYSDSQNILGL